MVEVNLKKVQPVQIKEPQQGEQKKLEPKEEKKLVLVQVQKEEKK